MRLVDHLAAIDNMARAHRSGISHDDYRDLVLHLLWKMPKLLMNPRLIPMSSMKLLVLTVPKLLMNTRMIPMSKMSSMLLLIILMNLPRFMKESKDLMKAMLTSQCVALYGKV